ncbi:MAG: hypothetical protein LQ342_005436 [Letrouitia transgressa]|nr:MAG: hypothetical protein LQ342_005436 [Letrouitia transgressa]
MKNVTSLDDSALSGSNSQYTFCADMDESVPNPYPPPSPWRVYYIRSSNLLMRYSWGANLPQEKIVSVVNGAISLADERIRSTGDGALTGADVPFVYDTVTSQPIYLEVNVCIRQQLLWSQLLAVTRALRHLDIDNRAYREITFQVFQINVLINRQLAWGRLSSLRPDA